MRRNVAVKVVDVMLEYSARLDSLVADLRDNCDEREFKQYRNAIGQVLGTVLLDILNPIFGEHPDLKPPQLTL